jgi:DinB family
MSTPAFLQGILAHEHPLFCNVVRAVPEDGRGYRCEPRARSAEELIGHLIGHNQDLEELLDHGAIHHRNNVPFETVESAVEVMDQSFGALIERLGTIDEATWGSPASFFAGEHLVMEAPLGQMAFMMLLDSIHHRGQLSTYLRPMGSKVPAIYGPSADDEGPGH